MPEPNKEEEIKAAANVVAEKYDADVLIFNFEIQPPVDFHFMGTVAARKKNRKNVFLILTTEGGNADSAFRMMRFLQARYARITVVVGGWCKSAGTLMCIGANEIQMGGLAELGPLDVQIVKADEMDEQKSGLVAEAAFEKLQQEAYKFFMGFVKDLGGSGYRVTLKTASDVAAKVTIGVVAPIFDKLDPVTIGEDSRSNRLGQAYAERLNVYGKNLNRTRDFDALDQLLSGYPSHGFVIDQKEAGRIFRNVKPFSSEIVEVVRLLGGDTVLPRSSRQDNQPRVEFLNDEPRQPEEAPTAAPERRVGRASDRPRKGKRARGAANGHGNPAEGSGAGAA
jgi:Serine dehydrogenase proteinase